MPYPPECKMPDLSNIKGLTNRLLVQLLIGETGIPLKVSLYRRNFIRLVDKALLEYRYSRENILGQIAEATRPAKEIERSGRYIEVSGFTNHMENCINALTRTFKLLTRIKSHTGTPIIPRKLRKGVEKGSEPVNNLRNAVEHIDSLIRKDELVPGQPIMLALTEDNEGIRVSTYYINFTDLATLIKNLHETGEYVLTIK